MHEHEHPIEWLCVNSHAGQKPVKVRVIHRWPKRIQIEAITETKLGGRGKTLLPGERGLVPSWAIHASIDKRNQNIKDLRFWLAVVYTTSGRRTRGYRARALSGARNQAEKLGDVIRVESVTECTEAEYDTARSMQPARVLV